jgi:hypothetical protein
MCGITAILSRQSPMARNRMLAGMAALALSFVFMHEGSGLAA